MMNMRSEGRAVSDDRTVRARLRDEAIELVAVRGLDALTARAVADRAGVSAASVINNFGSMAGLRAACDDHVAAIIRAEKMKAMSAGIAFDVVGALRDAEVGPLAAYLAAVIAEDSPAVAHLVDEMVDDAQAYLEAGVASGMIRPSADPRGRAVVMTLSSLGSLVMHRHLTRLLGVDLTAQGSEPSALAPYVAPTYELYAGGLFTDEFSRRASLAIDELRAGQPGPPQDTKTGDPAGPEGSND
jgi:AcrR family transcriptional regulator